MFKLDSPLFLRRVLLADAAASAATGLLLAFGADPLEPLLGLPAVLLRTAGYALLPFAALVCLLATRKHIPRAGVWAVIVVNALWVVDSVVLLASGHVTPTVLGQAFVVAQAIVVATFAELEFGAVRRVRALAA
ncbi:hypothetical protein [Noviherbaspirillum aridicola]|uniref:Integral membrane protein n=1 Tax=Noviherbaspirillum aridicola TaxID=2849687 RepID=A0ABQ4Q679_9BURK|nr:hypothetical protein [Noviherbaspirillum aridicola]GIZ52310.1 hypothetical protein NCCP691_23240 [Noviherbaspirillum aridicola]